MSKTFTVRRMLSAGIAAFAALSIAACSDGGDEGGDEGGHDMGSMDSESESTEADFNDADVTFFQMMIPHHEQAVDMAELAQGQAADPEVIELAEQIAAAQQPEIDRMTGLLEDWGQPTAMEGHAGMSMGGMATEEQMTELGTAQGADFDKLFVDLMIAHHEGAVAMAEEHQAEGRNADASAIADAVIDTQTAEIATLQEIQARL